MDRQVMPVLEVDSEMPGTDAEFTFETHEEQLRREFGTFESTEYLYGKVG